MFVALAGDARFFVHQDLGGVFVCRVSLQAATVSPREIRFGLFLPKCTCFRTLTDFSQIRIIGTLRCVCVWVRVYIPTCIHCTLYVYTPLRRPKHIFRRVSQGLELISRVRLLSVRGFCVPTTQYTRNCRCVSVNPL